MANRRPRTVDEIFNDFKGRRAGIVRALTVDVDEFYRQCDPNKENLCLFGHPNETWEVKPPVEEVPPEMPEPCHGINFSRVGVEKKVWLSHVAAHSDSWLMSIAVYFGSQDGFGKRNRGRLFKKINEYPTVREEVRKPPQQPEPVPTEDEEEEEDGASLCGICKEYDEEKATFWIFCKPCGLWFHNTCVHISQEQADQIPVYKCQKCIDSNNGDICIVCGEEYEEGEFWLRCEYCRLWYHGQCVRIRHTQTERINQFKCATCSK